MTYIFALPQLFLRFIEIVFDIQTRQEISDWVLIIMPLLNFKKLRNVSNLCTLK